jgi:hypothetical protein
MMFQQRSISGACCLLFLALGAAAVSPAARTTGALDVVLSFEGTLLQQPSQLKV